MNHTYVLHPNKKIPTRLCPRDEIAHPNKIKDAIYYIGKRWRNICISNSMLKYKRIGYDVEFYDDVSSSHFYVVADDVSVLRDASMVNKKSDVDMLRFLHKHQNSMFLITTPVFHLSSDDHGIQRYVIPTNILQEALFLEDNNTIELINIIENQCYTICNGVTLVLAMIRSNTWDAHAAHKAIKEWSLAYKILPEDTDMNDVWQYLYTNHPVPMVAEFPMYYSTMYPSIPAALLKYLEIQDTVPLSQFVDDTDADEWKNFYATPITSMFPYFNRDIFDYYNPGFSESDGVSTIFQPPYDLDDDDYQQLDIEGFLISMIRSRRAWKWWKKNGPTYLRKLWKINKSCYSFFTHCMMILFYLYSRPYKNIRYPLWRIRAIWNMMFVMFDITAYDIQMFITIHIIRNIIYETFNITRVHSKIPLAFMIDVLKTKGYSINWFNAYRYQLFTTHNMQIILDVFSPYIHVKNEEKNEYVLKCSLYQFMKLDTYLNDIFVLPIVDKRIGGKILCIDKIFGIKMNQKNMVGLNDNSSYLIGTVIKEYLRNHRNCLI